MRIVSFELPGRRAVEKAASKVVSEFPGATQPELSKQILDLVTAEFHNAVAELTLHQGTVEAVFNRCPGPEI